MAGAEPGAEYPRDVPVLRGMPEGWKGTEKCYGPNSKTPGLVYCRYYSLDGKHKHINSPGQVIMLDCKDKGIDHVPMVEEFKRLQKEQQGKIAEERRSEREAKGKLAGEARESAVQRFRDRFGQLNGPIVFFFKGWTTRWHFQPGCNQVMVEYVDHEGGLHYLLKDLECAFQWKMDNGMGDYIPEMIRDAKARADPELFSQGAKKARESGGVYETCPDAKESKVMTQEDRAELARQKQEKREASKGDGQPKRRRMFLSIAREEPIKQEGWAALESREDVQKAFVHFRRALVARGFEPSTQLVALHGASSERVFHRRVNGVYYQMPVPFAGQRCYQRLLHCSKAADELGCDGIYILWNEAKSRWEVATRLHDGFRPLIAHSASSAASSAEPSLEPEAEPASGAEASGKASTAEGEESAKAAKQGEKAPRLAQPPSLAKAVGPWRIQDGSEDFQEDGVQVVLDAAQGEEPAGTPR